MAEVINSDQWGACSTYPTHPSPQIIFTTESGLFNMRFVLSCLVRLFHCSVLSENLKNLFQTERVICVHCLQVTLSKCSNSCNTQQFLFPMYVLSLALLE